MSHGELISVLSKHFSSSISPACYVDRVHFYSLHVHHVVSRPGSEHKNQDNEEGPRPLSKLGETSLVQIGLNNTLPPLAIL